MGFQTWRKGKQIKVGDSVAKSIFLYLCECLNEKTGQCNPSQQTIADDLELSVMSVIRKMKILEKNGLIVRQKKRHGLKVIGTSYGICELPLNKINGNSGIVSESYDNCGIVSESQFNGNSQLPMIKKEEKNKNKNKRKTKPKAIEKVFDVPRSDVDVSLWNEFIEMRRQVKKPLTEHGYNLIIGKLEKLPNFNINERIAEAIDRKWLGLIFPNDLQQTNGVTNGQYKTKREKERDTTIDNENIIAEIERRIEADKLHNTVNEDNRILSETSTTTAP